MTTKACSERRDWACRQRATTRHQHAAAGRRDLADGLAQALYGVGLADQLFLGSCAQAQLGVLPPQLGGLQGAIQDQEHALAVEGLLDEIVSADLDGLDRRLDVAVPADHDDGKVWIDLLHALQDLYPVQARVLQPDIEDYETRAARLDLAQGRIAVTGLASRETLIL